MMNKFSKTVFASKKGVLFYLTRDVKNRTCVGRRFLVNVAVKNFVATTDKLQEDLNYYPKNYTYESIRAIFEGKDFTKNFNLVFKKEIERLEKMDSEFEKLVESEGNNQVEIKEKLNKDFSLFITAIKKIHKIEREKSFDKSNENILTESEKIELYNSLNHSYNPFQNMEKSASIEKIDFNKLNIFKYFLSYGNFIKSLNTSNPAPHEAKSNLSQTSNNDATNDKGINFMNSLCMIFIGNNIHQRILDEISRKTNIFILKGDYFNSLGYSTIASLGNPYLIRLYAKINENFAKSVFFKANSNVIDNKSAFYSKLFDYVVRKNIGFYYLGCLGLCELYNKKFFIANKDLVKEFTFKYGVLLYLREELAFIKDKSMEYYAKSEELVYSIFLFSEKLMNELCFDNKESYVKNLNKLLSDNNHLDKYKNFAISLCSELVVLIDKMQAKENIQNEKKEEMKNFLKMIFLDIEEMVRI